MQRTTPSLLIALYLSAQCLSAPAWAVTAPVTNVPATSSSTQPSVSNNPSTPANTRNPSSPTALTANSANPNPLLPKPFTYEQLQRIKAEQDAKIKTLAKTQALRLKQLEKANLDALSQNQELQLKNDNLLVQIQVLQSERSAQMFLYGAATVGMGVLLGFFIASYIYTKRRRQW